MTLHFYWSISDSQTLVLLHSLKHLRSIHLNCICKLHRPNLFPQILQHYCGLGRGLAHPAACLLSAGECVRYAGL